jgi:hypothetical protein
MDHKNNKASCTSDPLCRGPHERLHPHLCPILHTSQQADLCKGAKREDKALKDIISFLLKKGKMHPTVDFMYKEP